MHKFISLEQKEVPPCWILTSKRSGSTLLCSMLNYTKLYGPIFNEYFNKVVISRYNLNNFIFPPYNKVMFYMIEEAQIDVSIIYEKLIKQFPSIKFIHLLRKNKFKQAISLYFAHQDGMWRHFDKCTNMRVEYNYNNILKMYNYIMLHTWDNSIFLSQKNRIISITYEDLLDDINYTMQNISNFLEIKIKYNWLEIYKAISLNISKIMNHPLKDEYCERFMKEYYA